MSTKTQLNFNDGVCIRTDGALRIIKKRDGLYVVGDGMSCPVDSYSEGRELIVEMQGYMKEEHNV